MARDNLTAVFDSRSTDYKEPQGAVSVGTVLNLRLSIRRDERPDWAWLLVYRDDQEVDKIELVSSGKIVGSASYDSYECSFIPDEDGLYWYHFELCYGDHTLRIGRNGDGHSSIACDTALSWQQTVFERAYDVPDWIYGGIYYHIFVDRFNRVGERVHMDGKIMRNDWGGMPAYEPVDGKILNNDFFGGNLKGIEEKLPYLESLGVTCIYLSPISQAYSNHKYDTADYAKVDPMFGNIQDFRDLCEAAHARGMRILLDGVYAHTGADSVYFNRERHYGDGGAYNDVNSPYRDWYFWHQDGTYETWWGIDTLPKVNKANQSYRDFIFGAEGIVPYWLANGADGYRLDVVDELPSDFLTGLVAAAKAEKSDALIVGEVWEDASSKEAYGEQKNYFCGDRLDSVMNYPIKNALISFVRYGDAGAIAGAMEDIWENYPQHVVHALMNIIGTHDSVRALTALAGKEFSDEASRVELAHTALSEQEYHAGVRKLKQLVALQMTLPGVPCIYYGDEAGLEGYKDPFNRRCYPWGSEDQELLDWYRRMAEIRRGNAVYADGSYRTLCASNGFYAFSRRAAACDIDRDGDLPVCREYITAANCGSVLATMELYGEYVNLITGETVTDELAVLPGDVAILAGKII